MIHKLILVAFISFLSFSSFSKDVWRQHLRLIDQDIKVIKRTKKKDTQIYIRLFELYGEKLSLIIDKENDYLLSYLDGGKNTAQNLKKIRKAKKKIFIELEKLSKKLVKKIKKKKLLAKIYYFRALYNYMLKNLDGFFKNLKYAEKYAQTKEMKTRIYVKIAEHHYNQKDFKNAMKYYRRILRNPKDRWITKHLFNYAWCLIKLGKPSASLKYMKRSYQYSLKKGYFKLGEQLYNGLMFSFTLAHKVDQGINYLKRYKIANFKRVMTFLDYNFEHGEKRRSKKLIKFLKSQIKTSDDYNQYYDKVVIIYRNIKKYSELDKELKNVRKMKKFKLSKDYGGELISSLKGYTGFLQEIIRHSRYVNKRDKYIFVRYINNNFNTLSHIDPKNKLEYLYFQGETYFGINDYPKAIVYYKKGIDKTLASNRIKGKEAQLTKFFNAYFKSLEYIKKDKLKLTRHGYTQYLKVFPRTEKAKLIYLKYFNLEININSSKSPLAIIKMYSKTFPKDKPVQVKMYKRLVNKFAVKDDADSLIEIYKAVKNGLLQMNTTEQKKLSLIINQISFKKYNALADKGELDKALVGFKKFFANKTIGYSLRRNALIKILDILKSKKNYKELSTSYMVYVNFLSKSEYLNEKKRMEFYASQICEAGYFDDCFKSVNKLYSLFHGKMSPELLKLRFRISVSKNQFRPALDLFALQIIKNDPALKANFVQGLMLLDTRSFLNIFNLVYKHPQVREEMSGILKTRFITQLSFHEPVGNILNFCGGTQHKLPVCREIKKINEDNLISRNFQLPQIPPFSEGKVIFESFGKELQEKMGFIQGHTKRFEHLLGQVDQTWRPRLVQKGIGFYKNVNKAFSSYKPKADDPNLVKAINDELIKLMNIFSAKEQEYHNLLNDLNIKLNDRYGVMRTEFPLEKFRIKQNYNREYLWPFADKYFVSPF